MTRFACLALMLAGCGGPEESVRVPVIGPLAIELRGEWYDPEGKRAMVVEKSPDGMISAVIRAQPDPHYQILRIEAREDEIETWSRGPGGETSSRMRWLRGDDATEPGVRATLLGSCNWMQQDPGLPWILEARMFGSLETVEQHGERLVSRLVSAL